MFDGECFCVYGTLMRNVWLDVVVFVKIFELCPRAAQRDQKVTILLSGSPYS
jgi:hypothetical protein